MPPRRRQLKPSALSPRDFGAEVAQAIHVLERLPGDYEVLWAVAHERGRHGEGGGSSSFSSSSTETAVVSLERVRNACSDASEAVKTAKSRAVASRSDIDSGWVAIDRTIPQRIEPADDRYRERSVTLDDLAAAWERKARQLRSQAGKARSQERRMREAAAKREKQSLIQPP